ncbi:MAG: TlpA family protein disulfide reductase [Bacteroidota bacterium]
MPEKQKLTYLCLLLMLCSSSFAKYEEKPDSTNVFLYEFREPFFEIPVYFDTVSISGNHFYFTSDREKTACFYFDYGPYQCHFFAVPDEKYKILLPDISKMDEQRKKGSFYTPVPFHVNTKTGPTAITGFDLNDSIRNFNKEYEPFLSKQTLRYFQPEYARTQLDSFLRANYYEEHGPENTYFSDYKQYKKAILLYHLKQRNLDSLIREYFTAKPVRFEIPPYRTFFALVLGDYFDHLRREEKFNQIYAEFARLSVNPLRDYLQKDPLLKNDTILELVLLKESYNAFYSDRMNKHRLISFTDSIRSDTKIDLIKLSADNLKKLFTHLRPGFAAPVFTAEGIKGDRIVLKGKYDKLIYLGFCDMESMLCLQEVEYLKYLSQKHGEFIRIITILKSSSEQELRELSNFGGNSWQIIPWNKNREIAELFDVRAVPSFFLIGKDGDMLLNPAPSPSENFEITLFRILRGQGDI